MTIRTLNYLLVICFVLILIVLALYAKGILNKDNDEERTFKQTTEIVEGKVIKAEKDKQWFKPVKYQLVVSNNKGVSKNLEVNENQYNDYQAGAEVKFRIDKEKQNQVVLDLKKQKDYVNQKDYEKRTKEDKGIIESLFEY
ncbi:hypothetical protein [Staphylococcus aureus]|uniref:hypothetical protein n=1 Tax=Staphylococcus aureus TaxID=1280 RepID=UPI001BFEAFCA|nr:hypothetical protein [Staphylococcus aureus]